MSKGFNNVQLEQPITSAVKIHSYSFVLNNIILNESVSYIITLYDNLGNDIFIISGLIEGDEYNNWGTDDNYITTLINQKVQDYINKQ